MLTFMYLVNHVSQNRPRLPLIITIVIDIDY